MSAQFDGHVDGCEGCYIVGWSFSGPGVSHIKVCGEDGVVVAEGTADRDRPDVAVLGLGRTNIAFRILIPSITSRTPVRIYGDHGELRNSPTVLGPGIFDGRIELIQGHLRGWASERTVDFNPPAVRIVDRAGAVVADIRTVPNPTHDSDVYFQPGRFQARVPQSLFGRRDVALALQVGDMEVATCRADLSLEGRLDQLEADFCSGWLHAPNAPDQIFDLEIYRNGTLVGRAKVDRPRSDVTSIFPSSRYPGFICALAPPLAAGSDFAVMSVRLRGSPLPLFEGPFIMGARTVAVMSARKIANLMRNGDLALNEGEQAILAAALADFLTKTRQMEAFVANRQPTPRPATLQLHVVIPVYKGVKTTQHCIESVLRTRNPLRDHLLIIDDCSPDAGMRPLLAKFAGTPNVEILFNEANMGFVRSVNRALAVCTDGDVLLLNSDTVVFPGGLDRLWQLARARADIGTITAISNNATIFSYPHPSLKREVLDDVSWSELAAAALDANAGVVIDVPTGHGFCLLIKRELLDIQHGFDEVYGLGYAEENDFCAIAADLGFRNVAAADVFVEHKESVSFEGGKAGLIAANHNILQHRYPEYTPTIMQFEARDELRAARWALDRHRLSNASSANYRFVLIIQHQLGGGTHKAISDLETEVGYGGHACLTLSCRLDGFMELTCQRFAMRALFAPHEVEQVFAVIRSAAVMDVYIHQLLGFSEALIETLSQWASESSVIFYIHDFYAICPRVTMIDASGHFCGGAEIEICDRCIAAGGSHAQSQLTHLTVAEHRRLFSELLVRAAHVVAPSKSAAGYVRKCVAGVEVEVIPHLESRSHFATKARDGDDDEIVLIGAIGPDKGSKQLVELARRARITHPRMTFNIIGFTSEDAALEKLGNVTISGRYQHDELPTLLSNTRGRLCLFLSIWPETYSYTLSEAARYGFIPVVPDLGAMADRVREANFGVIVPCPINVDVVLSCLSDIRDGHLNVDSGGSPADLCSTPDAAARTRSLMRRDY